MGYGYGSRIQEIHSITKNSDGYLVVKGIGKEWADQTTDTLFEVHLDDSLIARSATLYRQFDGTHSRTRVTTTGTHIANELPPLAAKATFEDGVFRKNEIVEDPITKFANEKTSFLRDKLDFELISATVQSKAEFTEKATLVAPKNSIIIDRGVHHSGVPK